MTLLLTPFMSCSAKIPIYALFAAVFFPDHAALVMIGLYLGGIAVAVICALLMRGTLFKGNSAPFVLELPDYRLPSLRSVLLLMWEKAKDFIQKALSVTSMPTLAATSAMVPEPQERSSWLYLGTKASPSLRYWAKTPLPKSSPKA